MIRYISVWALGFLCVLPLAAENWVTHFAYNNVTQIAMSQDMVYALSDGSLFGVNKQSEKITIYNRLSGLHSTGISCIHYDEKGQQLLIAYSNGKIDILTKQGMRYIGDLYNKDMTQRKDIYNVTIQGRMAYLSTHFGVQTFDLRENKLVDSYWLRPGGLETPVKDVSIKGDSIYAFSTDSLYCASMKTNLSDYTVWKRELRSGRIAPDPDKGVHYKDANSEWYAGGNEGIIRFNESARITYKPQGPVSNVPYRLNTYGKNVWIVPGGRWATEYRRSGAVMHYDGYKWTNVVADNIKAKTGLPANDFMNVAVDPRDPKHYYVSSYGNGLFEFQNDTLVRQYLAGDGVSTLVAAAPNDPTNYTRVDFAQFDNENNLWMLNAGTTPQIHCIDVAGNWHALPEVLDNAPLRMPTPTGFLMDTHYPSYKWIAMGRNNTGVCRINDNGTIWDSSDDEVIYRSQWIDQYGKEYKPLEIYDLKQDSKGRIWICSNLGLAYLPANMDYALSDAILLPDVMDNNGENPMTTMPVKSICEDKNGQLWVGTDNLGIYVLSSEVDEMVAHYTTENSAMPGNGILSFAKDEQGIIYVGTSEGLVSYDESALPTEDSRASKEENTNYGSMQQWRLHFSYSDAAQIIGTARTIYARTNGGALWSLDRADESITYWNKSNGLNGSAISQIEYDQSTGKLIIGYESGMIDLLDDDSKTVTSIPDLYVKSGSINRTINSIYAGKKYTYMAMPFGIIALNLKKEEITDTYYIGSEAASVNVEQVLELGDSIYAFGENKMFSASSKDNLVDYSYWHQSSVLTDRLQKAVVYRDAIYTLQHDSLYRWEKNKWTLVRPEPFSWIHSCNNKLLLCNEQRKLFQLTDDNQLAGLSDRYYLNDAVYTEGEYWLAEANFGMIRLSTQGDNYYHPSGPNSNVGYTMHAAHGQIYSAVGGRWATEYINDARINIYDGTNWRGISEADIMPHIGQRALDPVSIAVDPKDAGHFYVATYGTGVYEFKNYVFYKQHTTGNSTLQPANATVSPVYYTRTDGALTDEQGNLWVLNPTGVGKPIHILSPDGNWHASAPTVNGKPLRFYTPGCTTMDRRNSEYKWILDQRVETGVLLFHDKGTPTYGGDDRCVKRSSFVDQENKTVAPICFRSLVQDHANRVWIGTEKGIIIIPAEVDFFTSNQCRRIIIPRNDGSNLGDYLLGEEQINCMAVDGGDRIWIGTENSGLYLIEEDTITVAHFTENNSLLPSNKILSIAIEPTTGEVFVGTGKGIASYRSDASEPQKTMESAYAYPNPVRPGYDGVITIAGLMENTTVNIIDAGGNLVCKTKSHGGTAVWDGKLSDGRKATPGVYTALCNANGGHTVVKILVIR